MRFKAGKSTYKLPKNFVEIWHAETIVRNMAIRIKMIPYPDFDRAKASILKNRVSEPFGGYPAIMTIRNGAYFEVFPIPIKAWRARFKYTCSGEF